MKFLSKKVIIPIILLVVFLIGIGIGSLNFIKAIENSTDNTNQQIINENASMDTLLSHQITEAMKTVSNNGKLEFKLSEYEMNQILYAISKDINVPNIKIKSIYLELTNNLYKLYVPISIMDIDTLVTCDISLIEKNDTIKIELNNIRIGNLHQSAINNIINILEGEIKKLSNKYHITTEIENGRITASITRQELKKSIDELTAEEPLHDVILVAYDIVMLRTNAVTLNLSNPQKMSIVIDLSCFGGHKSKELESFNDLMSEYIHKGVATPENISLISKYHVNGYNRLSLEEQNKISQILNLNESTTIYNGELGARKPTEDAINDLLREAFLDVFDELHAIAKSLEWYDLLDTKHISERIDDCFEKYSFGYISKKTIQDLINSLDILGTTITMMSEISNEFAYIVVDRTDLDIGTSSIQLTAHININGFVIPAKIDIKIVNQSVGSIQLAISQISIGNLNLNSKDISKVIKCAESYVEFEGIAFSGTNIYIDAPCIIRTYLYDIPILSNKTIKKVCDLFYIQCSPDSAVMVRMDNFSWKDKLKGIVEDVVNDCYQYLK